MTESHQVSLLIIIGTAGMLIMVAALVIFVVFYQKRMLKSRLNLQMLETEHQKKLLVASYESQENERRRVARDLHDEVGAMLSAINLSIGALTRNETVDDELHKMLEDTKSMVNLSIETVRRISRNLLPHMLEDFGLSKAIEYLIASLNSSAEITATFLESGIKKELNDNTELALYRSIQESINNAVKHSQGTKIDVIFDWSPKLLSIKVRDNGKGFEIKDPDFKKGLGLKNIESRLNLINAGLDFRSNKEGTEIKMMVNIV